MNPQALVAGTNILITGGQFTQHNTTTTTTSCLEVLEKAVTPGAMHNSGERFDPPRCHPNTRQGVLRQIMDWILGRDPKTRRARMMWLRGAAGAGKSAIAQTIAELCEAENYLVGSFFFNRSDTKRNHAQSLFPTIAYQMCLVFPSIQDKLLSIIQRDPMIFSKSLSAQFASLTIEPLKVLRQYFLDNTISPCVVIIDGLDECVDHKVQCQILDIIAHAIHQHNIPLIFLVASRPEHDISHRFSSSDMRGILAQLSLDDTSERDEDIRRFLVEKFQEIARTHPFRDFLPPAWPTDDVVRHLVRKSSGQFIYASTVVKYVQSSRRRPHHQLEIILDLRPATGERPFAELDALYTHIFSSIKNASKVLSIISTDMVLSRAKINHTTKEIECLLHLEPGDAMVLLCDLSSIVEIRNARLRILHASLADFLCDRSRAVDYHIAFSVTEGKVFRLCLQFVTKKPVHDPALSSGSQVAFQYLIYGLERSLLSSTVRNYLLTFSIPRILQAFFNKPLKSMSLKDSVHDYLKDSVHDYFIATFLPTFFGILKRLGNVARPIYNHHRRSFDAFVKNRLEVYYANVHLTSMVAMVDFAVSNPGVPIFALTQYLVKGVEEIDYRCLALSRSLEHRDVGLSYCELLLDFLLDPERAGPYMLNGERFATAAVCCWLRLHKEETFFPFTEMTTLTCLAYFLPRANRSDELIRYCQQNKSTCQVSIFEQYSRAQDAISAYLDRIGVA